MTQSPDQHDPRYRLITLLSLGLFVACILAIGALVASSRYQTRGIPKELPDAIPQGESSLGLNVDLTKLDPPALTATLSEIKEIGISQIKQSFYYSESFDWSATDRLVTAVKNEGLTLVPLLDGNPESGFSPPDDRAAFADWARKFAERYGDAITHYIIWDEPNLSSHWGGYPVNPAEYAALLAESTRAIRQADSDAVIVLGPLAPTVETSGDNLAEPLFLSSLYEAGAAESFDVVAGKPYGFDTGPDDRRVDIDRLNFSRIILLREVLEQYGDEGKAVWAGNWGWNSLPEGWQGDPSVWGQTSETTRAEWTVAALERARREWPWMGTMFLENWEPGAPAQDARWGFSIAGRTTADVLAEYLAALPENIAWPGFHTANPNDSAQSFIGAWEFSPEFGADIGQSGDQATFLFWGTDVGLKVRRADYRARFYVTVDGEPANELPTDENWTALVLTAGDPAENGLVIERVASGLEPGPHLVEITASRGWDQWALNGFSAGYRPPDGDIRLPSFFLSVFAIAAGVITIVSIRRSGWASVGSHLSGFYNRLSDRTQLILTGFAAAVVGLTGWMTWGEEALGLYRRLGDSGQLAATATAAAIFYVAPSFVIFSIALIVLFILLVLRPAWGVALIALTMPFYVSSLAKPIGGYRFSPVEVFALVATTAWLVRSILDAGQRSRRQIIDSPNKKLQRADWAVLAFTSVATLSLFFTERLGVATNEWRVVIIEPALFYLLSRVTRLREREMWVVMDAWVLSGLVVALTGLGQYISGQNLITSEGGLLRLRSFYGSPNNVALYLGRILPLLVAIVLFGRQAILPSRRIGYGLILIPVVAALVLTFSKGALFLGIPASMLLIFWIWQRRAGRRAWPWVIAALGVGIVGIVGALQIPALAGRLDLFGITGVFRLNLWRAALNMIAEHPVLGVGLDNFLYAYRERYILDAAWQEPNLNHPHNILLDFATRLGLLGLFAGGWLIVETIRNLRLALKQSESEWLLIAVGLSGSLAAMLAHGLVDHSLFLVDLAFAFFLIVGVSAWLVERLSDS